MPAIDTNAVMVTSAIYVLGLDLALTPGAEMEGRQFVTGRRRVWTAFGSTAQGQSSNPHGARTNHRNSLREPRPQASDIAAANCMLRHLFSAAR